MLGLSGFTCSSQYSIIIIYYYDTIIITMHFLSYFKVESCTCALLSRLCTRLCFFVRLVYYLLSSKASSDTTTDTASEG